MLRGILVLVLLALNALFWGSAVLIAGTTKLFFRGAQRRPIILFLARLGDGWVAGNDRIFDALLTTQWDVEGIDDIDSDGHYLIISNHVSWVDIFVLFRVFHRRTAFIRFFLKQQLIWMPVVGLACWALEFPFMKRLTPEYLERHPEKRGSDLETTRRLCRRYRKFPVAILNFVEGTRFTRDKHADQESPYRHLLRPRVGGISFVLASFGEQMDAIFDVTLAYPHHDVTMWELVSNRVPRIVVRARRIEVTPELIDPAITEPGPARDRLRQWIDGLWREKDALLDELGAQRHSDTAAQ
jgi:1-acyl-sn-glycerol-3-phosphate acyltransferase